eukprot:GFYU01000738.1.p2 GENE.GFYU01000738.1~~GFYU01000738.1.p2  ORF type:complete len:112 (-),score=59.18 GFYU01000738.1:24-359(-)
MGDTGLTGQGTGVTDADATGQSNKMGLSTMINNIQAEVREAMGGGRDKDKEKENDKGKEKEKEKDKGKEKEKKKEKKLAKKDTKDNDKSVASAGDDSSSTDDGAPTDAEAP